MNRYSKLSIALHWLIAALIIAAFALGFYMTGLQFSLSKLKLFSWHKWLGITVLGLVAIRLISRLFQTAPPYPESMEKWEKVTANCVHLALYFFMFAVPLSGYFYTYAAGFPVVYLGLFELPAPIAPDPLLKVQLRTLHEVLTTGMLMLISLHIAAALKHHFIDKDGITNRMLPRALTKDPQ